MKGVYYKQGTWLSMCISLDHGNMYIIIVSFKMSMSSMLQSQCLQGDHEITKIRKTDYKNNILCVVEMIKSPFSLNGLWEIAIQLHVKHVKVVKPLAL